MMYIALYVLLASAAAPGQAYSQPVLVRAKHGHINASDHFAILGRSLRDAEDTTTDATPPAEVDTGQEAVEEEEEPAAGEEDTTTDATPPAEVDTGEDAVEEDEEPVAGEEDTTATSAQLSSPVDRPPEAFGQFPVRTPPAVDPPPPVAPVAAPVATPTGGGAGIALDDDDVSTTSGIRGGFGSVQRDSVGPGGVAIDNDGEVGVVSLTPVAETPAPVTTLPPAGSAVSATQHVHMPGLCAAAIAPVLGVAGYMLLF